MSHWINSLVNKAFYKFFILAFAMIGFSANAQVANDTTTQNAILQALPANITAENATVDEIALAARTVTFSMEGNLLTNVTQVMISLGELSQAKVFSLAQQNNNSPTDRFFNTMINMASLGYEELTTLDITPLSKAMVSGMNYLNGVSSLNTVD